MADFNPDAYLASKEFDPDRYLKSKTKPISQWEATKLLAPRTLTFGLAPAAAGVGAAAGAFSGTKGSFSDKLGAASDAYSEGKKERLDAQNEAAKEYPKTALTSDVAGMLATGPLVAAGSVGQAVTKGAAAGAAYGVGEGDGLKDVGTGAVIGGVSGGLLQAASPYIGKGAGYVAGKLGSGAAKVASSLSGLPEEQIKSYAAKTPLINKLIKSSGGDFSEPIEAQRQKLLSDISQYRQSANAKIGEALTNNASKEVAPGQVLLELEHYKSKLHPTLQADEINAVDSLIKKYTGAVSDRGTLSPNEMNIIKSELQDVAGSGGAYKNQQGQIIGRSTGLGRAARSAGAVARQNINSEIPELVQPYSDLQSLHQAQNRLGGLLSEKGNPTTLLNAASGNSFKGKTLNYLSNKVGSGAVNSLKDIKTAQTFSNPDILSQFKTGRSLTGMAVGGAAGAVLDPEDRTHGAMIGAALSSPLAIKGLINAGNVGRTIGKGLLTELPSAIPALKNETGSIGSFGDKKIGTGYVMKSAKDALDKMSGHYEEFSQEQINNGYKALNDLAHVLKNQEGKVPADAWNLYYSLSNKVENGIKYSPNSNFAQTKELKGRSGRDLIPDKYDLLNKGAEIIPFQRNQNADRAIFPEGEVIPYKNKIDRNADLQKERSLDNLRSQINSYGSPVSSRDALKSRYVDGRYGWFSAPDNAPPEAVSAAEKYANAKNLEKARGGEFINNPPSKYQIGEEAAKTSESTRNRAIKQMRDNEKALSDWRSKLANDPNPNPEEVKIFQDMVDQHRATKSELKYSPTWKARGNLNKEGLLPGELVDARDAFEMWGARPSVKGKRGNMVELERGPYGKLQRPEPEPVPPQDYEDLSSGDQYYKDNPEALQEKSPGELIPENKFMDRLINQKPSPENEAIQQALDAFAKSKGMKGLIDLRKLMELAEKKPGLIKEFPR